LSKWQQLTTSFEKLLLSVKRCFRPADFSLVGSDFVLVIFADVLPVAFGAFAYLRVRYGDKFMSASSWPKVALSPPQADNHPSTGVESGSFSRKPVPNRETGASTFVFLS
jgi:hypothetical protein